MQKWEYKTKITDGYYPLAGRELDNFGDEGWELVQVVRIDERQWMHMFKRPDKQQMPLLKY